MTGSQSSRHASRSNPGCCNMLPVLTCWSVTNPVVVTPPFPCSHNTQIPTFIAIDCSDPSPPMLVKMTFKHHWLGWAPCKYHQQLAVAVQAPTHSNAVQESTLTRQALAQHIAVRHAASHYTQQDNPSKSPTTTKTPAVYPRPDKSLNHPASRCSHVQAPLCHATTCGGAARFARCTLVLRPYNRREGPQQQYH